MSIRVSNVLKVPEMVEVSELFSTLIDDQSAIEAPPFYETLTMRFWGSGTRVRVDGTTVTTEEIDYDESASFSREPANTPSCIMQVISPG